MSPSRLLFDDFELRPDSGELFKGGAPVKLQPQPARVLAILASRPGEVVERDEIRRLVWGDSFLDFDASLNFCIKQIRQALGDSATAPRFVETLPRRGYRFLIPVSREASPAAFASPPQEPRAKPWLATASVALLAGILFVLVGSRHARLTTPRLVVLPFECQDQGHTGQEVCGGITEVVTAELAQRFRKDLEVIAPDSARVYAGKSGTELVKGLDATHVLTSNVVISGRQLKMTARLSSTAPEEVLWQESAETDLGDAPLLYSQIVRGVARGLHLPPPPAVGSPQAVKPSSAAYEAYLRGTYLLKQDSVVAAASLQNAVLQDPGFADAYAKLARALDGVEKPLCTDMALIDAAARRALALDPNLAEAHLALAHSLFHCHLDWEQAGQEFRRSLALNPGSSETYHRYAFYLASLGRHEDAIAAARQARELDPASILMTSDFAYFFYLGRRYDEAIQEARRTLELMEVSPETPGIKRFFRFWTLWVLLHSAMEIRDEETAVGAGRGLMDFYGEGQQAASVRRLNDFLSWQESWLQRSAQTRPVLPYFSAVASMDSGRHGPALDALEEDCRTRKSFMLLFAGAEPAFNPLRGDPQFTRILDCIKLPADAPARTGRAQ